MIGQVIYSILSNDTAVNTAVSGRIRPVVAIQGEPFPAIVYNVINASPTLTKQENSQLDQVRVQISTYAPTYAAVDSIDGQVRAALDGQGGNIAGVNVDTIYLIDFFDGRDDELELFHRASDYIVRIKR